MTAPTCVLLAPCVAFAGVDAPSAVDWLSRSLDGLLVSSRGILTTTDGLGPPAWAARWAQLHPATPARIYRLDGTLGSVDERGLATRWTPYMAPELPTSQSWAAWRAERDRWLMLGGADVLVLLRARWAPDPEGERMAAWAAAKGVRVVASAWVRSVDGVMTMAATEEGGGE